MGSKANRPWLPLPRTRPATANRQFSPSTTIVSLSFHFETIILFECCTAASRNDPLLLPTWLLAGNYCLFSRPLETAQDFRNFRRVSAPFRAKCLVFLHFSLHDLFALASVFSAFTRVVSRRLLFSVFPVVLGRSGVRKVKENDEKPAEIVSAIHFDVISLLNISKRNINFSVFLFIFYN